MWPEHSTPRRLLPQPFIFIDVDVAVQNDIILRSRTEYDRIVLSFNFCFVTLFNSEMYDCGIKKMK